MSWREHYLHRSPILIIDLETRIGTDLETRIGDRTHVSEWHVVQAGKYLFTIWSPVVEGVSAETSSSELEWLDPVSSPATKSSINSPLATTETLLRRKNHDEEHVGATVSYHGMQRRPATIGMLKQKTAQWDMYAHIWPTE